MQRPSRRPAARLLLLAAALILPAALAAWWFSHPVPLTAKFSRSARYRAPAAAAWAALSDVATWPGWRTDLSAVAPQDPLRGHPVWREISRDGTAVTTETVEVIDNRRIVRCVTDQGGPFGGCWTAEIAPRNQGDAEECAVVLTEALTVHSRWFSVRNPPSRRADSLNAILDALGTKLGVEAYRHGETMVDVSRN